jgi:hypothetical protein
MEAERARAAIPGSIPPEGTWQSALTGQGRGGGGRGIRTRASAVPRPGTSLGLLGLGLIGLCYTVSYAM